MSLLVKTIGDRIVNEINRLYATIEILNEDNLTHVNSRAVSPFVQLRKRAAGGGREQRKMRISQGIIVSPVGIKTFGGTNERDDRGYRYVVTLATGTTTDDVLVNWWVGNFEQAIRRRFHQKRVGDRDPSDVLIALSGDDFCELNAIVETGELPDWQELEDGLDYTVLVITVYVRESR